jgi:hypothetical protein
MDLSQSFLSRFVPMAFLELPTAELTQVSSQLYVQSCTVAPTRCQIITNPC